MTITPSTVHTTHPAPGAAVLPSLVWLSPCFTFDFNHINQGFTFIEDPNIAKAYCNPLPPFLPKFTFPEMFFIIHGIIRYILFALRLFHREPFAPRCGGGYPSVYQLLSVPSRVPTLVWFGCRLSDPTVLGIVAGINVLVTTV